MRVVSVVLFCLVWAPILGACADPPAGPAPGGARHEDRRPPGASRGDRIRPVQAPDDGRWHLWVASRWSVEAVHDPWSPDGEVAAQWFFGPIADVAVAPPGLLVALETGAVVSMDASLRVTAVATDELSRPMGLAVDAAEVWVADADRGLLAFRVTPLGLGPVRAVADVYPHAIVATPAGLFAAVSGEQGDEVVHLARDLSVLHRWRSRASDRIEDLGYGPDGALYVVDGGPCVFMFDHPEWLAGESEPSRRFCRDGRAYHGVLPAEDADGYVAHDDGVDVFGEVSIAEDHTSPRHVIEASSWSGSRPRRLAHGWAP